MVTAELWCSLGAGLKQVAHDFHCSCQPALPLCVTYELTKATLVSARLVFSQVVCCMLPGRYVIYHGPVSAVQQHFESLGFELPERMDVPSWLVEITTPQGAIFCYTTPIFQPATPSCCHNPSTRV